MKSKTSITQRAFNVTTAIRESRSIFLVIKYRKVSLSQTKNGPEIIKLFPCSTQLSMKFFLLINVKMPTVVGILTFMSGKNSILGLSEPRNSQIS